LEPGGTEKRRAEARRQNRGASQPIDPKPAMIKPCVRGGVGDRDILPGAPVALQHDGFGRKFARCKSVVNPLTREGLDYARGIAD
jgi:hypothetical protein